MTTALTVIPQQGSKTILPLGSEITWRYIDSQYWNRGWVTIRSGENYKISLKQFNPNGIWIHPKEIIWINNRNY